MEILIYRTMRHTPKNDNQFWYHAAAKRTAADSDAGCNAKRRKGSHRGA